jgi:hypothetical protein
MGEGRFAAAATTSVLLIRPLAPRGSILLDISPQPGDMVVFDYEERVTSPAATARIGHRTISNPTQSLFQCQPEPDVHATGIREASNAGDCKN